MKFGILIVCLTLAACGGRTETLVVAKPQPVAMPVAVKCNIDVPERPALPIDAAPTGLDNDKQVNISLATIKAQEVYIDRLETALRACAGQ